MCYTPSSFRSEGSLPDLLKAEGIVAIEEIDTRRLTRHIRDTGAKRAIISTTDLDGQSLHNKVLASPSLNVVNLVQTVSTPHTTTFVEDTDAYDFIVKRPPATRYRVVAYDCGIKRSLLRGLNRAGCQVTLVPWDTPAAEVLSMAPDGVFISNGPGDPNTVGATIEAVRSLFGQVPLFGIGLGFQVIALAAGGRIERHRFGHHGSNQPVTNLRTGLTEITAQNHGFGPVFSSLGPLIPEQSGGYVSHPTDDDLRFWIRLGSAPVVSNKTCGRIQLTQVNLNDGTCEGLALLDQRAFGVQYHPDGYPGPAGAHYLPVAFTRLMDGFIDYLDVDQSTDRLAGWR
jgi:carbamoyl-phosphate synthase small subunit